MNTIKDDQKRTYAKPTLIEIGKMQIVTRNNDQASTSDSLTQPTHVGRN